VYSVCSVVSSSFKIGVDGGGTKTELILVDPAGAGVATHMAPGCNPSQVGPDQARTILLEALRTLRAKEPGAVIQTTHLYMAGAPAFWREVGAALSGFGTVVTGPDSAPVLELATGGAPGLVLHAGTGSFVSARDPGGSIHYVGGLGWKFGDPGSGFDLGRRGLAVALLELQARPAGAALSPLAAALCAHTGLEDYAANSRYFYSDAAAHAKIAAFAPRVVELATANCGPAQQVIADSLTDLARQADDVIHRHFPRPTAPLPCGVSGRILNSPPAATALRSLASQLNWPVELRFLDTAPIEGVRRLLLAAR
jgi:glucosamine kinase